jgi:hypothetical protein
VSILGRAKDVLPGGAVPSGSTIRRTKPSLFLLEKPDTRWLRRGSMKHYRVNKLARPGGGVVKARDILASTHSEAVQVAREHEDCPVCEVWHAGQKVGSIT